MNLLPEFKKYLLSQSSPSAKVTVKNYLSDISRFVRWFEKTLGSFAPELITPQIINQFKQSNGLSPRSLERNLSSLRKFFNFLKLEGHISQSPFELITHNLELITTDPYRLKNFKNYLYVYNASGLTIKNYLMDVKKFLNWLEEVTDSKNAWDMKEKDILGRIDSNLIEEYKRRLPYSPRTINRKLSSLRKYLKWAVEEGLIEARGVEVAGLPTTRTSVFRERALAGGKLRQYPELITARPQGPLVYSKFPPLRLIQKTARGLVFVPEFILIKPLASVARSAEHFTWKLRGKPVFERVKDRARAKIKVKSLSKEVFAPFAIATTHLPIHKKLLFHIAHTRPNWYVKYHGYSFSHYLHLGLLMVFMSAVGFGIYQNTFSQPQTKGVLGFANPQVPPRILSFQGKLTDSSDNPITSSTNLRFSLYDSATGTGSALLWQEVDTVTPDSDGIFSLLLGNRSTMGQDLFAMRAGLWLGVTVGQTAELTPRQRLATVAYAENADNLQGLPPITQSGSGTNNVVLALDSSGNLTIGGTATPTFQATGGQFTLSGNPLLLTTTAGSNSNVTVNPNGRSFIDLQKPLQNSSNNNNISSAIGALEVDDLFAILATSSGQSALTVNQNGAGPLISASSSGTAKFTVDNSGNTTIAGGNFSQTGAGTFSTGTGSITLNGDATISSGKNFTVTLGQTSLTSGTATSNALSLTDTALTSGTGFAKVFTSNAGNGQTTIGESIALTDSTTAGGGYTGLSISTSGSGTGSGNKYLLDLNPGTNKEVVFDSSGAFRPTVAVSSNTNTLGSPSFYWKNVYADQVTANTIAGTVSGGSTSSTSWTIGSTQTGDVNEALIFQRNSGSGNATLQWNAGAGDLRYLTANYPLNTTYTVNNTSIGTTIDLLSANLTNNTTSGTQKLLSLTNTGTGTTADGIYINNTGTGTTALEIAGTWTNGILTNNNSINTGTGTLNSGNFTQTGASTFSTGTGAVSLNGATTVAANTNFALASGTGTITQTYTNSVAGNASLLSLTNNNAGAGVSINGFDLNPTNNTAPLSGTNTLNVVNFEAGAGGNSAGKTTNGINFASATGYANFLKTPTITIDSSGNISGAGTIAGTGITATSSLTDQGLTTAGVVLNSSAGLLSTLAGTTTTVLHGNASGLPTFASISGSDLTSNIAISTTGNISTTGTGTITSAGLLTGSAGLSLGGNLTFSTDNSFDIGASGATRPRTGYFGTSVFNPLLVGGTGTTSTLTLKSTSGVGASGADIIFQTGNNGATEAMRILNSGNVGIGNTAPTFKLDVLSGTINTGTGFYGAGQNALALTAPNVTMTASSGNIIATTNDAFAIDLGGSMAFGGRYITASANDIAFAKIKGAKENATTGNTAGYLAFGTNNPNTGLIAERMRIDSSGNVGIGTNGPGAQLQVNPSATTTIGEIIKAQASQTANLLELRSSLDAVLAKVDALGNITGNTLTSTVAQGTAPLTVTSTTTVANLNAAAAQEPMPNLVLNSDFSRRNKWMTFMNETFPDTSGYAQLDAGTAPTVVGNALTFQAANNEIAWPKSGAFWRDHRASVVFKLTNDTNGIYKLRGHRIDANNIITAQWDPNGTLTLNTLVGGGSTNEATAATGVGTVGNYYWLELEVQGPGKTNGAAIAKLYSCGGTSACAKSSATLVATASKSGATIANSVFDAGAQVSFTVNENSIVVGGLATGDGGVYVEGWGFENWGDEASIAWTNKGGLAFGLDETADVGPTGQQYVWRHYIPASNRSFYSSTSKFAVKPSTTYTLSWYEKTLNKSGADPIATLAVNEYNSAGTNTITDTNANWIDAGETSWTRKSGSFTTGSTAATARVYIMANYKQNTSAGASTGTAFVAGLQLEEGSIATPWRNAPADDDPIVWELERRPLTNISLTNTGALAELDPRDIAANYFLPWDATVHHEIALLSVVKDASSTTLYVLPSVDGDGAGQPYSIKKVFTTSPESAYGSRVVALSAGKHRATVQEIIDAATVTIGNNALGQTRMTIRATKGKITSNSSANDLAEEYSVTDPTIEAGDVVRVSANQGSLGSASVERTDKGYDPSAFGVISTAPAITFGNYDPLTGKIIDTSSTRWTTGTDRRPVALKGRVPVKVTNENGPIHRGDTLTSSATYQGYAMKATKAGPAIGIAMEDFSPVDNGTVQTGKIMTYVNLSWYDPDVYLTSTGDFVINKVSTFTKATADKQVAAATPNPQTGLYPSPTASASAQPVQPNCKTETDPSNFGLVSSNCPQTITTNYTYQITSSLGNAVQRVGVFSEAVIGTLKTGLIQTKDLIADNITVNNKIISPIAEVQTIKTNTITSLGSNKVVIKLQDNSASPSATSVPKLEIQNASGSAVATFDDKGNASVSGQLSSKALNTEEATISGTLKAKNIIADNIDSQILNLKSQLSNISLPSASPSAKAIDIASYSAQLATVDTLQAQVGTFMQGLFSVGPTSLSDATVFGQLSVGGNLVLADSSINVLGSDLKLQSLGQGGILLGKKIVIDANGNLSVDGDAKFNGTLFANIISPIPGNDLIFKLLNKNASDSARFKILNASGSAVASIDSNGNALFNKLNLNIVSPVLALSDHEFIATGSAGIATVSAHLKEVTILNKLVTGKSLIYITPVGTASAAPFLLRQVPEESFTVGVQNESIDPTTFNWLIIN